MTAFWIIQLRIAIITFQYDANDGSIPTENDFRAIMMHTPSLMSIRLWTLYYTKEVLVAPEVRTKFAMPNLQPFPKVAKPLLKSLAEGMVGVEEEEEEEEEDLCVHELPDTRFIGPDLKKALAELQADTMRFRANYPKLADDGDVPPYSETQAYFWIRRQQARDESASNSRSKKRRRGSGYGHLPSQPPLDDDPDHISAPTPSTPGMVPLSLHTSPASHPHNGVSARGSPNRKIEDDEDGADGRSRRQPKKRRHLSIEDFIQDTEAETETPPDKSRAHLHLEQAPRRPMSRGYDLTWNRETGFPGKPDSQYKDFDFDVVEYWVREGCWPSNLALQEMEDRSRDTRNTAASGAQVALIRRKVPSIRVGRKRFRSESDDGSASDQATQSRDVKSARYNSSAYETLLETKNSFLKFAISGEQETAVMKYYRHKIHAYDFTVLDGRDKWTAYRIAPRELSNAEVYFGSRVIGLENTSVVIRRPVNKTTRVIPGGLQLMRHSHDRLKSKGQPYEDHHWK
ncbi:hypothetical protein VP1G_09657 [Cytospora mali]|uniref:Uncharacterized protein n=1 Tax=Cytospora mali TaxID=578113 RepID=A0A194VEV2_CYTMA|nr:hypothetical protein VP1G_09657 [Valsa mali var. pyri (nom. inval.)]